MLSLATFDKVAQYQEDGFLIIEDFLNATELEQWRETTQAAVDDRLATLTGLGNQHCDDYYRNVFTQCLKLIDTHAGFSALMKDERIGRIASQLAGVDGIRIWHDQALFKPPFGNPTSWHLDVPYWSFDSREAISMWIALDDATMENGCMWYLPGTHKTARFDNVAIGANMSELFQLYPEWKDLSPRCAPCKAGSAVFHNGLVAHAAGPNMTPKARRAITCAFMPDGSTFNGKRNILSEEYFKSLTPGQLLDNEKEHPLVWRAVAEAVAAG